MSQWMQCNFIQTNPVWADSSCPLGVGGHGVSRGKKRQVIVRMSEVQNRADTAEFLKQQLRLRHPASAFEDTSAADAARARELAAQAKREKTMRAKAAVEAKALAEAEAAAKLLSINNENMRLLIMLASAV